MSSHAHRIQATILTVLILAAMAATTAWAFAAATTIPGALASTLIGYLGIAIAALSIWGASRFATEYL